jgi:hypothetical protein
VKALKAVDYAEFEKRIAVEILEESKWEGGNDVKKNTKNLADAMFAVVVAKESLKAAEIPESPLYWLWELKKDMLFHLFDLKKDMLV